jgi:hypothetical protein
MKDLVQQISQLPAREQQGILGALAHERPAVTPAAKPAKPLPKGIPAGATTIGQGQTILVSLDSRASTATHQ